MLAEKLRDTVEWAKGRHQELEGIVQTFTQEVTDAETQMTEYEAEHPLCPWQDQFDDWLPNVDKFYRCKALRDGKEEKEA